VYAHLTNLSSVRRHRTRSQVAKSEIGLPAGIAHLQSLVDVRYRTEGRMDEFRRLVAGLVVGLGGGLRVRIEL